MWNKIYRLFISSCLCSWSMSYHHKVKFLYYACSLNVLKQSSSGGYFPMKICEIFSDEDGLMMEVVFHDISIWGFLTYPDHFDSWSGILGSFCEVFSRWKSNTSFMGYMFRLFNLFKPFVEGNQAVEACLP